MRVTTMSGAQAGERRYLPAGPQADRDTEVKAFLKWLRKDISGDLDPVLRTRREACIVVCVGHPRRGASSIYFLQRHIQYSSEFGMARLQSVHGTREH